jgi:hypothetical protein
VKTSSLPFDRVPLLYERAFGGWDRQHKDPDRPAFEPRNPVGIGLRTRWHAGEETVAVPNLEDPAHLIQRFDDRPAPAGFGFLSPHWQPRAALSGTCDAAWMQTRMPKLPADFDRRFFNAASPGLVLPSRLRGDEQVTVMGASPAGRIDFKLPAQTEPVVDVELRRGRKETLQTELDTVIVDMDDMTLTLLWRAHRVVRDVPHDVAAIRVHADTTVAA